MFSIKSCFFLLLVFLHAAFFAQYRFELKADGGVSEISSFRRPLPSYATDYFMPSGNIGVFYSFNTAKRLFVGMGLIFSQLEGKSRLDFPHNYYIDSSGAKVEFSSVIVTKKHVSYLGIPVYMGIRFKKLSLISGFRFSLAVNTAFSSHYVTVEKNITYEWRESSTNNTKTNSYRRNYSLHEELLYRLNKRLELSANYHFGINSILSPGAWMWYKLWNPIRTQQVTIGVRYILKEKEAKKQESAATNAR